VKADFKILKATQDGTRFDKVTALVIGSVAILAAILGTFQVQTSQDKNRALQMAARLSVELTEKISGSTQLTTFEYESTQQALALGLAATNRTLAGLDHPEIAAAEEAKGTADSTAADRLVQIATTMALEPAEGVVDQWTREVLLATPEDWQRLVAEQNRQVDLADVASARSQRSVLGLSFIALAGVMAGLTGVLGEGRNGLIALSGAIAALVAALGALVFAML
jgi:hypothetical protein